MDTASAFMRGQSAIRSGAKMMVFDWDKAAQLIRDSKAQKASAGLRSDWEWTGGTILENGLPVSDDYTYLSSPWAVPELDMDDGGVVECWRYQDETPGWDSGTSWPESARAILGGSE